MDMSEAIRKIEFMRDAYQKLIDEKVDEGTFVGSDITGTWKAETPLTEVYRKHVEACNMAIDAMKSRWIPVSEALPEENGCYLVTVKNDHERRYSKTAWFCNGSWTMVRQKVIAWRSLPAPYEGDGE